MEAHKTKQQKQAANSKEISARTPYAVISHKAGARLFNNYIIQLPFHGSTAACNTQQTLTHTLTSK